MRYLYVTWDAPDAAYLESLFVPIFERLRDGGLHLDVLQFTWGAKAQRTGAAEACRRAGIGYAVAKVRRGWGGAGPLLTAVAGSRHVLAGMRRFRSDAVLARSTMPAIAVMRAARRSSFPFAFDADGLPLDERVEFAGLSPTGFTYRLLRDAEAQMVRRSGAVLVRTRAAREVLIARAGAGVETKKFHIVTNGRDPTTFAPLDAQARTEGRRRLGLGTQPILLYAGSLGGGKYLLEEMLLLFRAFREMEPSAVLLLLTPHQRLAREALAADRFEDLRAHCLVTTAAPGDVAAYMGIADGGMAAIAPTLSMTAAAPIKTAEYLLCGLPVLGTPQVGDNEAAIEAGVFCPVDFLDPASRRAGAAWLAIQPADDRLERRRRAREIGVENFSLEASAAQYRDALLRLRPDFLPPDP